MLEKVATSIDRLLDMFTSGYGKKHITDYVNIETVNDNYTLVAQDGSLITILKVVGNINLYYAQEYMNSVQNLEAKLSSLLENKDHKIQLFFEYDHDNTRNELRSVMEESWKTNKRLKLNLDDVLYERENNLMDYVCAEKFYIALWTTTSGLSKEQLKNQKLKNQELNKDRVMPLTILGQDPLRGSSEIVEKHVSFLSNFVESVKTIGVVCEQLNVREGLREMRKCFDKKFTEETWEPFIPGDTILPSVRKKSPSMETYDIMYPKLSHQLCPSDAIISGDIVEMGDRLFSSVFFELFPQRIESFQSLFINARNQGLPWRYSLLIEGGGLSGFQMKGMIAHLLSFSNSGNKLIRNDIETLKEYKGSIVTVRATFTTWAPKSNPTLMNTRLENLKNILGSWGSPAVSKTTGDPVAALASSALSITQGNIGTKTAAPLGQILYMSPFSRPCSVWDNGSVVLRTPDGKILPYEPFSSKQKYWVEIIAASMGSGKSVLMNVLNIALCLNPNITQLPRIGIIDIGPSSSGLISLLKEGLPAERKHEVLSHKFKNIKEQSVNPLDTSLGCREPTTLEMSFLTNLVGLLATDPMSDKLEVGMSGLIMKVLKEVYVMKSDLSAGCNKYSPGFSAPVDLALFNLKKSGIELNKIKKQGEFGDDIDISWWEIVDFLFENGKLVEAKLAQRYAVPQVIDLLEAANTDKIKSEYSMEEINAFSRNIKDALGYYPVLSDITRFDVDLARVVSIDLDEVAKGGGPIADRMTVIMYMLARYLLAKDFYVDDKIKNEVPIANVSRIELPNTVPVEKYKNYHYVRGSNIIKEQKRLVYDEFHRVSTNAAAESVIKQVTDDIRVGRKYQIDIMMASQSLADFGEIIIELSSAIFVMDASSQQVINNVGKLLGMEGDGIKYVLKNQLKGPGKGGGVFFSKFKMKNGNDFNVLASATLGPIEMWAFTTTACDTYVRNGLYKKMNPSDARKLLSRYYPNGLSDAVDEMLKSKQNKRIGGENNEMMLTEKDETDTYDKILADLLSSAEIDGYKINKED